MNYSIIEEVVGSRTEYRVRDESNQLHRGRFHTREAALSWIEQQQARVGRGRQAVHEASSIGILRDYAGDNERLIREIQG